MLVSLLNALDPYASAGAARKERRKAAEAAPFIVLSAQEKDGGPARRARRVSGRSDAQRAEAAERAQARLFAEPDEEAEAGAVLPEDALDGQALYALLKADV
jgi:hypothetical protein